MSKQKQYRSVRSEIIYICESAKIVEENVSGNTSSFAINTYPQEIHADENEVCEMSIDHSTSSNESDSEDISVDSDDETVNYLNNIQDDISEWSVTHNITRECLNSLLNILRKYHPNLPKDGRSLKKTPRNNNEIIPMGSGSYSHIGLEHQLKFFLERTNFKGSEIVIDIGVDGIPLTKSSKSQLWPILANVVSHKEIFLVGAYHGYKKPDSADEFLQAFVREVRHLIESNILYNGRTLVLKIRAFVCDAPARAFLLGVKSHSGYCSCTKCMIKGCYLEHRICFPGNSELLRTDESFRNKTDTEHHLKLNIALDSLPIGCVSQFPIDYMHCVCLGVMRQMINLFIKDRKKIFSLKRNAIDAINYKLQMIRKCIPVEFQRRQRTFRDVDNWKASEFRTFVCYTGMVAFHNILEKRYYDHFLLLSCSIRILAQPNNCIRNNECAAEMLRMFCELFPELFGKQNVSYNVHNLLHITADV